MVENIERIGSFTSSNIFKLMTLARNKVDFGKPALTYIHEKRMEKRMGRSLELESYSRAMAWGLFMESYVFSKIGIEYLITSKDTDVHPNIKGWSGSKDLIVPGLKVSDIKCYEPKKFGDYTDALLLGDIDRLKED